MSDERCPECGAELFVVTPKGWMCNNCDLYELDYLRIHAAGLERENAELRKSIAILMRGVKDGEPA